MDLSAAPALGRDVFFPSPANEAGWHAISPEAEWPGGRLLLIGPEGSGKTHLATIWAQENGARICAASALAACHLPDLGPLVVVEDVDRIAGDLAAETALFHLYNMLGASAGGRLLLTARTAPSRWGLTLPDLGSRLQSITPAILAPPDDILMSAVLLKLFADRQTNVAANLIPYLTSRIERSIDAARRLVDQLDRAGIEQGRPLTRALAAEVLDSPRE